jgi:tetratricopeptide repeat protein 21B
MRKPVRGRERIKMHGKHVIDLANNAMQGASTAEDVLAVFHYYARKGFYRHMATAAATYLSKLPSLHVCSFFQAVGSLMEGGAVTDAIRSLSALQGRQELALATAHALLHAHSQSLRSDADATTKLSKTIESEASRATPQSFVTAGYFLLIAGDFNQARIYADKAMASGSASQSASAAADDDDFGFSSAPAPAPASSSDAAPFPASAAVLRAWVDVQCGRESYARKANEWLDKAASGSNAAAIALEAGLCRAAFLQCRGKIDLASAALDSLRSSHPWCPAVLTEHAALLLSSPDAALAAKVRSFISQAIAQDATFLEASRLAAFDALMNEPRPSVCVSKVEDLTALIFAYEPRNTQIMHDVSKFVSRACGRSAACLSACAKLSSKAVELTGRSNTDFLSQLGLVKLLQGRPADALADMEAAYKLDAANTAALHGGIRAKIAAGNLVDLRNQLEFLNMSDSGIPGEKLAVSLLQSLLAVREESETAVSLLQEAISQFALAAKDVAPYAAVSLLDQDALHEVITSLLVYSGSEPISQLQTPPASLESAKRGVAVLTAITPHACHVRLTHARVLYLLSDMDAAQAVLTSVINADPSLAHAHVLAAQVFTHKAQYEAAEASLDQALSHNLTIKSDVNFMVLKGRLFVAMNKDEEGIRLLDDALVSIRKVKPAPPALQAQHLSVLLYLAQAHSKLKHIPESARYLQEAQKDFGKGPHNARILMIQSELYLQKRDIDAALKCLAKIDRSSAQYSAAKMAMANIHLQYRNNPVPYEQCFTELVEAEASVSNFCLLADAYMKINEPAKAKARLMKALKMAASAGNKDRDRIPDLQLKLGSVLVACHDYDTAMRFYEEASKSQADRPALQLSLAELYMKLKMFDKAEALLHSVLEKQGRSEDVSVLIAAVKTLRMQSVVLNKEKRAKLAIESLTRARNLQHTILSRLRGEQADVIRQQRQVLAALCHELALLHNDVRDVEAATSLFNESLRHDEKHTPSMFALASISLDKGNPDDAQLWCSRILKVNAANEEASMMLADIMFQKGDFESAIFQFEQLLGHRPNHWVGLSKLLHLLRKAGRTGDAKHFLDKSEKSSAKAGTEAGFHYCKGLFLWFTRESALALHQFNAARQDVTWGRSCIEAMLGIYLDPVYLQLFEESGEASPSGSNNHVAAQRLLEDLKMAPDIDERKLIVHQSWVHIHSKAKPQLEQAITLLAPLQPTKEDSGGDYVPGLLAAAYAQLMLKQESKARNVLKRLIKLPFRSDDAEEFEKAWLLMADMYIQSGKFDVAKEFCQQCLTRNKSCSKVVSACLEL